MKCLLTALLVTALVALSGCANGPVVPQGPYDGLSDNSYGPLIDYVDSTTQQPITPPLCDPDDQYQDVNELSRQITAFLVKPISGAETVDPSIELEGLQGQFKMPGDIGTYNVTLLDRDENHIVFWYNADLVILPEVSGAAGLYCSRFHKQAVYEGSARMCGAPQRLPVIINGKTTMIPTYAISAFLCQASPEQTAALAGHSLTWQVQFELGRLGFLNTAPDGFYGPNTRDAIEAFQHKMGIPVDGIVSEPLFEALENS